MNLYYFSIALTVASNLAYHLTLKLLNPAAPPITALFVTYLGSLVTTLVLMVAVPGVNAGAGWSWGSVLQVGWVPLLLGLSLPGLELGFLLAYRAGWPVGLAAMVSNVSLTLLLIPIGLLFFQEHISLMRALGIAMALAGLILIGKG